MSTITHPPGPLAPGQASDHGALPALTLAAIGVVFGDIGTSPLYTVREIFGPAGVPLDAPNVIGAVSAIVWALMLVVTLKYVLIVLRADHRGEGGVLALAARAAATATARRRALWMALGLAGATLFYADSLITPAISVLGAMEGLVVLDPAWERAVVPLSVAVLLALFALQRHGTAVVGRAFGPVIVLWFLTLALSGLWQIGQTPEILLALDPRQALHFLVARGPGVLLAVGAIVLALTGAEALYADMGHFGRRPIRLAWCGLVLPALALNYLGQGALLLREPAALANPFFRLFPEPLLLPALLLATLAAIIASQAVISGAYSMTRQAIQLGYLPRMRVRHTSARAAGQVYLPGINLMLLLGVLAAVLGFGSSSALAAAYGVAVTLTMLVTTLLVAVVARADWGWPAPLRWAGLALFLSVDALLVAGCLVKLHDGGWMPLALGGLLFLLMRTWATGRQRLLAHLRADGLSLDDFVRQLTDDGRPRVPRTAVYPVADPGLVPQALLHNLKHNQVLHERNLVLTVQFAPTPQVAADQRLQLTPLGAGFWRATLRCGFMEEPDVPGALAQLTLGGVRAGGFDTSYFLSRETVVPVGGRGMARWRERLFAWMSRQAGSAANYFGLPDNAVVELGTRVQV